MRDGRLTAILPDWQLPLVPISVRVHPGSQRSRKVALFVNEVERVLATD